METITNRRPAGRSMRGGTSLRGLWEATQSVFVFVCLNVCLLEGALTALPEAPRNLTLVRIFANAAIVSWNASLSDYIVNFEMTLTPLGSSSYVPQRMITDVDGSRRSYVLRDLSPTTEYELYVLSFNYRGMSNSSDVITFRTLEATAEEYREQLHIHPAEVVVVVFVLAAWICAIALFLHKWGKIRITQPGQMRYKHAPKNLETITVVSKPCDSVIHKNYSQTYTRTRAAREKKLARMNTMPNIKVNTEPPPSPEPPKEVDKNKKFKAFSRTITSPVLEIDELTSSSVA